MERRLIPLSIAALIVGSAAIAFGLFLWLTRPGRESLVARPTASVVMAVRDLARLETASYHIERVIDLRDRQERLFGLIQGEDAILLIAAADVIAGIDLTEMKPEDIVADPAHRRVVVRIPPPTVFSARLDSSRTFVHTRHTDVIARRNDALETKARQEAEETIRRAAISAGILDRASANARRIIRRLLYSLGYEEVSFPQSER